LDSALETKPVPSYLHPQASPIFASVVKLSYPNWEKCTRLCMIRCYLSDDWLCACVFLW